MENLYYDSHVETWRNLEKQKVRNTIENLSESNETYQEYSDFMACAGYLAFMYGLSETEIEEKYPSPELSQDEEMELYSSMGFTPEEYLVDKVVERYAEFLNSQSDPSLIAMIRLQFGDEETDPILQLFTEAGWIDKEKIWQDVEIDVNYSTSGAGFVFRFNDNEKRCVAITMGCNEYDNKHGQINVRERYTIEGMAENIDILSKIPENLAGHALMDYVRKRQDESSRLNAELFGYSGFPDTVDTPKIIETIKTLCEEIRFAETEKQL